MSARFPIALLAVAALNALLVVGDFLETRWALVPAQLSLELAALVGIAALLGRRGIRPGRLGLGVVALLLSVAVALRLADIVVPWYFGRDFNAVADLRYVGFGLGLMRDSTPAATFAAILAGVAVAILAQLAVSYVLVAQVWRAAAAGRWSPFALVAAAAVLAFPLVPARYDLGRVPVAGATALAVGGNTARALDAWGLTGHSLALIQQAIAARPPVASLDGLGRRNVLLVFVESYGTITFTDPAFRAGLAETRARWAERLPAAGYHVVSDVIDSPITGGGSWMAHASMNFGVRVDSQPLFDILLTTGARALGQDFRASGYRTVAAQPRMQQPWLQADFFGFDHVISDLNLGYRGPRFSWETVPDQFVFEQVHRRELAVGDGRPRFVMYVLSSTHAPFDRIPGLLADAARLDDGSVYDGLPATSFPPPGGRVFDNRDGYLAATRYSLSALEQYLTTRLSDDSLVIVLGDHQPPLTVAAETRNKAVPIHVISRDPALVAPFRAMGFADGVEPKGFIARRGMETFLAQFLAAFGARAR